ncbi:MAG: PIN domain-containing protein [Gammaproteobacteria bacterium]|nr:MAG: PIN domain-containing protein [Gammaproteobacteria bacterium]
MIAVATNILVCVHRWDSDWHEPAVSLIKELAEGLDQWSVPWPSIHEFFAIVAHPNIYAPPSTVRQATAQIDAWLDSASLVLLGESRDHWTTLKGLLAQGKVRGPLFHDTRIAALCISHGIIEFLTADRDFSRFPTLSTGNPLLT